MKNSLIVAVVILLLMPMYIYFMINFVLPFSLEYSHVLASLIFTSCIVIPVFYMWFIGTKIYISIINLKNRKHSFSLTKYKSTFS